MTLSKSMTQINTSGDKIKMIDQTRLKYDSITALPDSSEKCHEGIYIMNITIISFNGIKSKSLTHVNTSGDKTKMI